MEENNDLCREDIELLNKAIENMPSLESQLDPKYLLQLEFEKNPEPYKPEYDKYILEYYNECCYDKPFSGAVQVYFECHAFDICYEYGLGEVCKNYSKQHLKKHIIITEHKRLKYNPEWEELFVEYIDKHGQDYYLSLTKDNDDSYMVADACGPMSAGRFMSLEQAFCNFLGEEFCKKHNLQPEYDIIKQESIKYI